MNKFVWYNPFLPQTLMIGVSILYFRAVFGLIFSLGRIDLLTLAILAGYVLGAFGIANLRWWGILVGVISVGFTFIHVTFIALEAGASIFDVVGYFFRTENLIGTLFDIAIIALLLHPMSMHFAKRNFTKRIP